MWMRGKFMYTGVLLCCGLLAGCIHRGRSEFQPTVLPGPVYTMSAEARTVPAGSIITLTSVDDIVVTRPPRERFFDAVISRDVLNRSGTVLIPNGSPASLVVLGSRELELGLHSVMVNGDTYLLDADGRTSGSSHAEIPLGTLLDAAAPRAVQVSTRDGRIYVPAGTLLTFELRQSFRLAVSGGVRQSPGLVPSGL